MDRSVRAMIGCFALLATACGGLPGTTAPPVVPPRVTVAAPVLPTATPEPQGVLFRYAFKPGETRRYAHEMTFAADGPDGAAVRMNMTMRLRYRVLEVHGDGSATIVAGYDGLAFSVDGRTRDVPEMVGVGVRMRVHPNGSTSEVQVEQQPLGGEGELDAEQLAQMVMSEYPARALSIGDSFERQFPLTTPDGPEPIVLHSRVSLDGLLEFRGQRAARLVETVAMPARQLPSTEGVQVSGQMGGRFSHFVDLDSGWPISGSGTLTTELSGDSAEHQKSASLSMQIEHRYQQER